MFELPAEELRAAGAGGCDGVDGVVVVTGVVLGVVVGAGAVVVVVGGGLTGEDGAVVVVPDGTVLPGTVIPGIVMPGMVTPGTVTPGMVTPGTDTVGVLTAGTVPALLACGIATKMDSSTPASSAIVAVNRPARPSTPLEPDLSELSTGRPLTSSEPRWVRPRKIRSQSPAS